MVHPIPRLEFAPEMDYFIARSSPSDWLYRCLCDYAKGALDASDASYVSVQLNYPKDVPVKEILEKGKQLEQDLMKQPEAETVIMQSGNSADAAQWGLSARRP